MRARDVEAAACLAIAALAPAQDSQASRPSAVEVARMLESGDPRRIAWGAFHARAGDTDRALPHLMQALGWLRGAELGEEWRCAALQVLDVLLAAKASVRAEELEPMLDDGETRRPALALLARDGKANVQFFTRLQSEEGAARSGWETLLAGSVLAQHRARGFAARVLAEVELTLCLRIRGGAHGDGCCGVVIGSSAGTAVSVAEGFPSTPFFRWAELLPDKKRPEPMLVAGRNGPTRVHRTVCTGRSTELFETQAPPVRGWNRLAWLADALGCGMEALGIDEYTWQEVAWTDRAGLERALSAARVLLKDRHARLVARLVAAQALDAGEAQRVTFEPRVILFDRRVRPAEALPDLPGVEIMR